MDSKQEIKGYRKLNEQEINLINDSKVLDEECGRFLERLSSVDSIDKRFLAIGKTNIQLGFMSVVRAIAKPETF